MSTVIPSRRRWWETPPLSARPATPVSDTTPPGVASPSGAVTRSTSAHVAPPCTCTVRRRGVEAHRAHRRQVDHEAVVDDGGAGDVVAAAADGERQRVLGGEADGRGDVAGVGAARDQGGALVDHAVPHPARAVVVGVLGGDDVAGQVLGEQRGEMGGDGGLDGHGCAPSGWGDGRSLRAGRPATVPVGVRDPSGSRPACG